MTHDLQMELVPYERCFANYHFQSFLESYILILDPWTPRILEPSGGGFTIFHKYLPQFTSYHPTHLVMI